MYLNSPLGYVTMQLRLILRVRIRCRFPANVFNPNCVFRAQLFSDFVFPLFHYQKLLIGIRMCCAGLQDVVMPRPWPCYRPMPQQYLPLKKVGELAQWSAWRRTHHVDSVTRDRRLLSALSVALVAGVRRATSGRWPLCATRGIPADADRCRLMPAPTHSLFMKAASSKLAGAP